MTHLPDAKAIFSDTQLLSFIEGTADSELAQHIGDRLAADSALQTRLATLDPGLPGLREAMDDLVTTAPDADLAAAYAAALQAEAMKRAAEVVAPASDAWTLQAVVLQAIALAAAFAVGFLVASQPPTELVTPKPDIPPRSEQRPQPQPEPNPQSAPERTAPIAASPAEPPVASPPATAPSPAEIPVAAASTPDTAQSPTEIAAPASSTPVDSAEPATELASRGRPSPSDVSEMAKPEPWVEAVASYVRLMTPETLEQTGRTPARLRARLMTMSKRFDVDLTAIVRQVPELTLRRVEVLQFNGRPLLQLGFLDRNRVPVAVCIIMRAKASPPPAIATPEAAPPSFRREQSFGLEAVHWSRQPLGLLVIGSGSAERLSDAANRIDGAL